MGKAAPHQLNAAESICWRAQCDNAARRPYRMDSPQHATLVVDDIHEEAAEPIDEWILGEFQIQVFDKNGNRISDTRVRKVLKEDDFE